MSEIKRGFMTRSDGALVNPDSMPLRIMPVDGGRTLKCPYELAPWDVAVIHNLDPKVARIGLVNIPTGDNQPFERDIFISKTSDEMPLTMTGYLFTGPLRVYAWKDRTFPPYPKHEDAEWREILSQIQAEHVHGYQEALQSHREKLMRMNPLDITTEDALKIYKALIYSVPR